MNSFFYFTIKMTNVFDENNFVEEFMTYFNTCNEYDITMVFDLFYTEKILNENRIDDLLKIYFPNNYHETDEQLLYDKLYNIIESSIVNDCESQADTDIDEEF